MKTVHEVLEHKPAVVWSVHPEDTVYDAIRKMADHDVGALLVMVDERLEGIISERDYARKVILKDKHSKRTRVEEIMSRQVVHASPSDHVDECVALMDRHRIRHLPIMEDDQVVGVVSARDLFATIIQEQASTIDQMQHYIRGEV